MSKHFLTYLQRQHACLDEMVDRLSQRSAADPDELSRLKKLRLAARDQLSKLSADIGLTTT